MFRVNYPFYETVLWSAKRVKKVKLFGRTCLMKFAKSLREFLSSFCVIAVFLEVWEFNTEEVFATPLMGYFGANTRKKLFKSFKILTGMRHISWIYTKCSPGMEFNSGQQYYRKRCCINCNIGLFLKAVLSDTLRQKRIKAAIFCFKSNNGKW